MAKVSKVRKKRFDRRKVSSAERIVRQIAKLNHGQLTLSAIMEAMRVDIERQSGYLHRMVEVERKLLRGIVHLHERPCGIPTLKQADEFMAKPLRKERAA